MGAAVGSAKKSAMLLQKVWKVEDNSILEMTEGAKEKNMMRNNFFGST